MSKVLDFTWELLQRRRNYTVTDDMDDVTSGGKWTNTTSSGGAVASYTGAGTLGGQASLTCGTSANSEVLRAMTNPIFVPSQDCPFYYHSRHKYTEQNTNNANIYAGFSSLFPLETLQASSAGPNTNYSGFGFYKTGGQTTWSIIFSNGTTQNTLLLSSANLMAIGDPKLTQTAGGGIWTDLECWMENVNATQCDVLFKINGVLVHKFILQTWTGMTAMSAGIEFKAGSTATNAEVMYLDYQLAQSQRFSQPY